MTPEELFYSKAEKIIESKSEKIFAFFKQKFSELIKKSQVDLRTAFIEYSKNSFQKYSLIKTILYKNQPRFLYDFFECNNLLLDKTVINCEDVNNVLVKSHFNLIVGNGGMGKSTLMKHFFLNALQNNEMIPLFIELRGFNKTDNLLSYCYNIINNLGFNLEEQFFEYALKSGMFLILFDGYDEITDDNKKGFLKKIEAFTDRFSDNYFIVSSRPCEEFIGWSRFFKYETEAFSKEKALRLINKIDYDKSVKQKFLAELDEKLYDNHKSFASNPLLLNIMLLTYENYAEIPEKLHIFYSQAFDTLFSIHDATKPEGFKRNLLSGLPSDVFKIVFSTFCFSSYVKGKIEFTHDEIIEELTKAGKKVPNFNAENYLEDIKSGVCLIFIDGLNYRFIHRSFQEYFTALYLKNLDDNLQETACCNIIKRMKLSFEYDTVFSMLQDMAPIRFEKNVILPYLKIIEEKIKSGDRVRSFYCYLVESVIISDNKNDLERYIRRTKNLRSRYYWIFRDSNVSFYISFNRDLNIHFLLFVSGKYQNKRQTSMINLSKLFSKHMNTEITKETIYKDSALFSKIITETSLGVFVRTISGLYDSLEKSQKDAVEEIEAFFQ